MDSSEMELGKSHSGCILRITKEEWLQQVFDLRMYYTGLRAVRWKPDMAILFARKSNEGDSFIGYGIVQTVKKLDELTENEKLECQKFGWRWRLDFSKMWKFEPALPLKNTPLADIAKKGKFLHGHHLTEAEIAAILSNVKNMIES
jgi:hypothetical protein